MLSFLNIETNSIFLLDRQELSGGICKEIVDEEGIFLPNYEQEQQMSGAAAKPTAILDNLLEKLVQCKTKVNGDAILKLLNVTANLSETQFMNHQKLKHQDVPHKEIIRVLVNDIAKNQIAHTCENLKRILQDAK